MPKKILLHEHFFRDDNYLSVLVISNCVFLSFARTVLMFNSNLYWVKGTLHNLLHLNKTYVKWNIHLEHLTLFSLCFDTSFCKDTI